MNCDTCLRVLPSANEIKILHGGLKAPAKKFWLDKQITKATACIIKINDILGKWLQYNQPISNYIYFTQEEKPTMAFSSSSLIKNNLIQAWRT